MSRFANGPCTCTCVLVQVEATVHLQREGGLRRVRGWERRGLEVNCQVWLCCGLPAPWWGVSTPLSAPHLQPGSMTWLSCPWVGDPGDN